MGILNKFWKIISSIHKRNIIVAVVIFVIVLCLMYLFFRFSYSISNLSNPKAFPSLKENIIDLISLNQTPIKQDSIDLNHDVTPAGITNEIKTLYPAKKSGRVWNAKWSNGEERILISGQRDPFDSEFIARGNGDVSIDGNGVAQIEGDAPRMYVYDRAKKKKWKNVEVTVYAKRVSESGTASYQGIVIGARSEHQDATSKKPCLGATYYGRLLYDGRAVFQKEVIHEGAYSSNKPMENNKVKWDTPDGTMPKNEWIGVKFIVKNSPKNKTVRLELYRDLTDGYNGGTWEKVAEYTDKGKWAQTNSGVNIAKKCGYSAKKILLKPGTSVFLRNDYVKEVQYKSFSIKEIK